MTLVWPKQGNARCEFRHAWLGTPLNLSLGTAAKREAKARHDAVQTLVTQKRREMIDQLRSGMLTVARVEAMVRNGEPLVPIATHQTAATADWGTVDDCIARYLTWFADHPRRAAGTADSARNALKRFADFVYEDVRLGARPIVDITSAMFLAFQASMRTWTSSPNTVTVYASRAAALWTFVARQEARDAREQRRAARTIYAPIDREMLVKEHRPLHRILTVDEMALLLANTPDALRFPICAGLMAGLRIGEVCHLRPGLDVDLERGTLSVRDQSGWKPKTKRSRRTVPMAATLAAMAKRHYERYASASWMLPRPQSPNEPAQEQWLRDQFAQCVMRAGLPYGQRTPNGLSYHALRRTFASHCLMQKIDVVTVADLLGDSVPVVIASYKHLLHDHTQAAVDVFAALIPQIPPAVQVSDA